MSKKHASSVVKAAGFLATFNHKLFSALETSGIPEEKLYELLKGEDPQFIDQIVKLFVGDAESAIRTLADMLKAGRYDRVSLNITEEHFPVNPAIFTTEGSKLFHFNRCMNTAQIEAAIRSEHYEPDPIEKLLAYGAKNPEEQRKGLIVALLRSSWVYQEGDRWVSYLYGNDRERYVGMGFSHPENRWYGNCRFLASPQVQR